jgi:hypothetical protein
MRRADDVLDQALADVVTRNPALALRWYDKVGSTGTFPRPPRLISPRGGWQQDYFGAVGNTALTQVRNPATVSPDRVPPPDPAPLHGCTRRPWVSHDGRPCLRI